MYMALSDTAIRQARASGTDYTLKDADGLALFVTAQGSKSWHFRFCWGGKQPRISLGIYPEISLKDARIQRDEARNLVAKGIDPRAHRRHPFKRTTRVRADRRNRRVLFRSLRSTTLWRSGSVCGMLEFRKSFPAGRS